MKELMEKRVELMDQMNAIVTAAETETRSLTAEEAEKFDACKAEIEAIDKTIKAKEEARNMEKFETPAVAPEISVEEKEYRAFDKMLRGMSDAEIRANMVDGSSGVVLPKTISQKILGLPVMAIYENGEQIDSVVKEEATADSILEMIKRHI